MDLVHVAVGGGSRFLRTFPVQPSAQVRRVPVPPIVLAVRLLELSVMLLCFVKEFGKRGDVDLSRWRRFPFAAGKACLDFLKQVTVPVRILE